MDVNEFFFRFVLPPTLVFLLLFGLFKWAGNETLGRQYVQPAIKSSKVVLESVFGESTTMGSKPLDGVRVVNSLRTEDKLFVVMAPSSKQLLLLALMIAFMVTWPASIVQKIFGVLFGMAYFFSLDVARVVSSLLIEVYIPTWFELFKYRISPVLFVTLIAAYLIVWLMLIGGGKMQEPVEAEA